MADDVRCLNELRRLREKTNWQIEGERRELLRQLYSLVMNWEGQRPDFAKIFRPEEIDWLILQDYWNEFNTDRSIVRLMAYTAYTDRPNVDEDGKPVLHRTTPIHHLARPNNIIDDLKMVVTLLFMMYVRRDVNYIDETGFTHFHAACKFGCYRATCEFLQYGRVDPDLLVPLSGNSPLHLAVANEHKKVAALLLEAGADPNLTNAKGSTPLHVICQQTYDKMAEISFGKDNDKKMKALLSDYTDTVELLLSKGASPNVTDARGRTPLHIVCQGEKNFALAPELMKICKKIGVPLAIDVRDETDRTALHVALEHHNILVAVELLAIGARGNSANEEASTPLHHICRDDKCSSAVVRVFLTVNEGLVPPVRVDAKDESGRTPLQWAVAYLQPEKVDLLLDHGADLSNFVFPTENYFAKKNTLDCTLQVVVFHTMSIVNSLERKGYQMEQTAALTIMKTFAEYKLFAESMDIHECLNDDEDFKRMSTEQLVKQNLSLYDFIQLSSLEMFTFFTKNDYETFKPTFSSILPKYREAFDLYLCQSVAGVFFRRWALTLFSLSKEEEEAIGQMEIEDLWDTCKAAAKKDAEIDAKKDAKKDSKKNRKKKEK